jgi:hypothetical protein
MRKKKETYDRPIYSKHSAKNKAKSHHSILKKHNDVLESFRKRDAHISEMNSEINSLKSELSKSQTDNEKRKKIQSEITKLSGESIQLKNTLQKEETDYLLQTVDIIHKYIELNEKEELLLTKEHINVKNKRNNQNDIEHKEHENDDNEEHENDDNEEEDEVHENEEHGNKITHDDEYDQEMYEIVVSKKNLIEEYLKRTDPNYQINSLDLSLYFKNANICQNCNSFLENNDGFAACIECGLCVKSFYQGDELSYKELQEMDYRSQFSYDKMTHFEEWIKRFEAKENKMIPQEVLDKVIGEAKKARIKDLNTLNETQIRAFLKKLGLNEYYDNKIAIINRINGRPPFVLIPEVKEKLKEMFRKIQAPYEKHKDSTRRNMFSYPYLINKFFLILDLPEFSKYFSLLKSVDKLRKQDKTFKKIVEELAQTDPTTKWRFFPSG